jgi:hypothetical protein
MRMPRGSRLHLSGRVCSHRLRLRPLLHVARDARAQAGDHPLPREDCWLLYHVIDRTSGFARSLEADHHEPSRVVLERQPARREPRPTAPRFMESVLVLSDLLGGHEPESCKCL